MEDDGDLFDILKESPKSVAELLKAAAHQGRVRILSLLLEENQDLSSFVDETGLSKNAIVNHLTILIDNGLVERVGRGEYALTHDGLDLIKAAASVYRDSTLRKQERRRLSQRLYASGWSGEGLKEITLDREIRYQPCWISYTGAMAGALRSLGVNCDTTDIGGHSGYAFIVNVLKGEFCPSGPTAFYTDTYEKLHWGVQNLGWKIVHWFDEGSYPRVEEASSPQDVERAQRLFDLVRVEIEQNRPVVLWGLHIPEYGIVKGIRGNSYLTSSFKSLIGQPEEPVLYIDLKAPGCLDAYFFRETIDVDAEKADRDAVDRGLRFARCLTPAVERYVNGPRAWAEWADILENHPEQELYHGNSYNAACYHEARQMASEFLDRVAKRRKGAYTRHLGEASKIYGQMARLLGEFTKIFPFKMEGEMSTDDRMKGAKILKRIKPLDERAAEQLEKALEKW